MTFSLGERLLSEFRDPGVGYLPHSNGGPPARPAGSDFAVGEPRFTMPVEVRREFSAAVAELANWGYSPPPGDEDLREVLRSAISSGQQPVPDLTVGVTGGAKEAVWLSLLWFAQLNSGLEVFVPTPGWIPYRAWAYALDLSVGFYDPVRAAIEPSSLLDRIRRPSVVILNYPNNPTGVSIDHATLTSIVETTLAHDGWLVSDEVYRSYAPECASVADIRPALDRSVVIGSASKTLSMPTVRIGWAATTNRELAQDLVDLRATSASCPPGPSQVIVRRALTSSVCTAWLDACRARTSANASALVAGLAACDVRVVSHGGMYVWCERPAQRLQQTSSAPVARVTDGATFGAPGLCRICVARESFSIDTDLPAIIRGIGYSA